jgi:hypothetical protein
MNVRFRVLMTMFTGAALALSATTAASAQGTAAPAPSASGAPASSRAWPKGTLEIHWGRTKDGKDFSYETHVGDVVPAAAPAAAAIDGSCTVWVSDLSLDETPNFIWDTAQFCSGNYGSQALQTEIWRSSFDGWRAYGGWGGVGLSTSDYISEGWWEVCHVGKGIYDYTAAVVGYSTVFGSSPYVQSVDTLNDANCSGTA